MPGGIDLRCSAIVVRQQAVLLIHRTYDGAEDWVLPGGTPSAGESTAACARREVREETGLRVDPARVAFVLEVVGPGPGPRTLGRRPGLCRDRRTRARCSLPGRR